MSVDDTIAAEGRPAPLVAYVEREHMLGLRSNIERVPVSFSLNKQGIGQNIAAANGRAAIMVQMPVNRPQGFRVHTNVHGQSLDATGRIFHWRQGRVIVAVDIDHTICQTDYDKLLLSDLPEASPPIPHARDTLVAMTNDYYILYLTARPRFLLEKTRHWLAAYNFPEGPVVAAPRLRDSIRTVEWKSRALAQLREAWPDLLIGIGNHNTDAEAYSPSGMLPVIIYSGGQEMHYADAIVLQDWNNVQQFFQTNRETLTDPRKTREVVEGRIWLSQPIIPWHEPKRNVKTRDRVTTISQELTTSS